MSALLQILVGLWLIAMAAIAFFVRRKSDVAGSNRLRKRLGFASKDSAFAFTRVDLVVKVAVVGVVGLVLVVRGLLGL